MTFGPRLRKETCIEYRDLSRDHGITLSIHASYFIVFTSDDAAKVARSADTLKRTFELPDLLGADGRSPSWIAIST
jgi:deoxyribonuclease IV